MPAVCPPLATEMVSALCFPSAITPSWPASLYSVKNGKVVREEFGINPVTLTRMTQKLVRYFEIDLTWQLFFLFCFFFHPNAEFVMVTLSLRFVNVTVAETEFTFYNCSLVQQLSGRRP